MIEIISSSIEFHQFTSTCFHMDMNRDYMHVWVARAHDSIALEFVVALAVDGSVTVLVDNNIHFDYVNHPEIN